MHCNVTRKRYVVVVPLGFERNSLSMKYYKFINICIQWMLPHFKTILLQITSNDKNKHSNFWHDNKQTVNAVNAHICFVMCEKCSVTMIIIFISFLSIHETLLFFQFFVVFSQFIRLFQCWNAIIYQNRKTSSNFTVLNILIKLLMLPNKSFFSRIL